MLNITCNNTCKGCWDVLSAPPKEQPSSLNKPSLARCIGNGVYIWSRSGFLPVKTPVNGVIYCLTRRDGVFNQTRRHTVPDDEYLSRIRGEQRRLGGSVTASDPA